MKKLIIAITVLITIGAIGYGLYQYYYPQLVAEAIVNDKFDKIVPKKYQPKFKLIKDTVNSKMDRFVEVAEQHQVPFENILLGIDEVQEDDVRAALAELQATKIKSVEQAFDIGLKHIKIQSFDPELLREAFVEHVKIKHIKKGLKYIERHDLEESMDPETAKAIVKQILKQKKEKVLKKAGGEIAP